MDKDLFITSDGPTRYARNEKDARAHAVEVGSDIKRPVYLWKLVDIYTPPTVSGWDSAAPAQPAEAEQERFRVGETVEGDYEKRYNPSGERDWRPARVDAYHPHIGYSLRFDCDPERSYWFVSDNIRRPAPKPLAFTFGQRVTIRYEGGNQNGVIVGEKPTVTGEWKIWNALDDDWEYVEANRLTPI